MCKLFTVLVSEKNVKRQADKVFYGQFHESILRNLIAGKTNPKNLTSLMKIKGEIAQIVFRYIDTKIYTKVRYEKKSRALFEELGLIKDAKKYQEKGKRQALLKRVIDEIDQLILSTGNVLRIKLEKADGVGTLRSFATTYQQTIYRPEQAKKRCIIV